MTARFFTLLVVISFLLTCAPEGDKSQAVEASPDSVKAVSEDTVFVQTLIVKGDGPDAMVRAILPSSVSETISGSRSTKSYAKLSSLGCLLSDGRHNEVPVDKSHAGKLSAVYKVTVLEENESELPFRMTIRFQVKDYPTWKWLYDSEEKRRTNAGLQLQQLGTEVGSPGNVFMIYALSDIKKVREMMKEPELKEKMEQAGVIGEAEVCFWKLTSSAVN